MQEENQVIKQFLAEKNKCTGCGLCLNVCSNNAIELIADSEDGYLYPVKNDNCTRCGRCSLFCPEMNEVKIQNYDVKAFSVHSKNEELREKSSSGGIFGELALKVLEENGVVCGAMFDEELYVNHCLISRAEELDPLLLSKYMQSNMRDMYVKVAELLREGKQVLFCGTPCQVQAMRIYICYLKLEQNLFLIDLLCKGIPSAEAAHIFIREIEKKYNKKVVFLTLKDKTYGWHQQKSKYMFEDGSFVIIKDVEKDYFSRSFVQDDFCIRRSCYHCRYKCQERVSDITIGDFWGIQDKEIDDDRGTSAVLINTEKGMKLFDMLASEHLIKYKKCSVDEIAKGNKNAFNKKIYSTEEQRQTFWKELRSNDYESAVIKAENMKKRNEVLNNIKNKKIILFGAGNYAKKFYQDYHEQLSIAFCITNNVNENHLIIDGRDVLPVYRVQNISQEEKDNSYIIICAADYKDMEKQIMCMDYIYGKDYMHCDMFRLLMSRKKISLFYGVCYMRPICECLKYSEVYSEEYETFYMLSYLTMDAREYNWFIFMLEMCDIYVYNTAISQQERIRNEGFINRLSPDCKRISVPSVGAEVYHPQAINYETSENPYNIVSNKTRFGPFVEPDWNINRMLEEGRSTDEILDVISDEDFYAKAWVEENFNRQIRKIQLQESSSNIKISDYIVAEHGKRRLFLNGTHVSNEVIVEIARRLLLMLGFELNIPEHDIMDSQMINMTETPVYPSVIKALNLSIYQGENVRYKLYTFNGGRKVTFEEYVKLYCEFCNDMMKYIKGGFFP